MNRWLVLIIGIAVGIGLVFGGKAIINSLKPVVPPVVVVPDTSGTIHSGTIPTEVDKLKIDITKLKNERDALKAELNTISLAMGTTEAAYDDLARKLDNLRATGVTDSAQIADLESRIKANREKMRKLNESLNAAIKKLDELGKPGSVVYTYKRFGPTFRLGLSGGTGFGVNSIYNGYVEPGKRLYADAGLYAKFLYADIGKYGVYTAGIEQSIFRPKSKIFIGRHINDMIPFFRNLEVRCAYVRDWNGYNEGQIGIGVDF